MTVDLDAIARRGRCEVAGLKLAQPLLEQGYQPPFLARYRRDELGGIDEPTLWALKTAMDAENALVDFREELLRAWEQTPLVDPAIGSAIRKCNSRRTLDRLRRRLRSESGDGAASDASRLAVRILNPQKGDGSDFTAIAASIPEISDAEAAVAGAEEAIADRMAGDPRVISAAVRWLSKNAKIFVSNVSDPHISEQNASQNEPEGSKTPTSKSSKPATDKTKETSAAESPEPSSAESPKAETAAAESAPEKPTPEESAPVEATAVKPTESPAAAPSATVSGDASSSETSDAAPAESVVESTDETAKSKAPSDAEAPTAPAVTAGEKSAEPQADASQGTEPDAKPEPKADSPSASKPAKTKKPAKAPAKKKKVSPRQRRRRWLVSVLQPLSGKRFAASKLSAFQIVMLGRGLRSQVAVCSFEYDAAKLVAEISRTVAGLNRAAEDKLGEIILRHEANLREAAEGAWWDELHEKASSRLVTIAADQLHRHVNRGSVEAKIVMSIDAVGPRTAATAIVSSDGRVLHGEDIPCQLQSNLRSQAVAKMGELIHKYNVDLVVISNGPSRRACIVAMGDLLKQSPDSSIRWTLADRSGADAYAGSDVSNAEMKSTPRRFRAAAWLAFSILHPAQAYAKIDPLKLRLASFQSELSDDALALALESVMTSGASQGGVDANSAPTTWLQRLPGMNEQTARSLDEKRRAGEIKSREDLLALDGWESVVQSRQAMPFLRVFGSEETLDGTLIHPDDYPLAKKLAGVLDIELPSDAPPGYVAPTQEAASAASEPGLVDATAPPEPAAVEDISEAGANAAEFKIDPETTPEPAEAATAQNDESQTGDSTIGESTDSAESVTNETETTESTPTDSETVAESGGETAASEAGNAESNESDPTAATETPATETGPAEPVRIPVPEQSKIDKCIKEWQVGKHRVNQLVRWLCDPFGDSISTAEAPAVLTRMPALKALKQGDQVVGVVVGVMPFGVFVELAPDCSGLVHVSRISDGFVEDLHEAVQVGDVLTAWVTGIDEKRRRVALSAMSPQREAEVQQERQQRQSESPRRGGRGQQHGGPRQGGGGRGKPAAAGAKTSSSGGGGGRAGGGRSGGGRNDRGGGRGGRDRDGRGGARRGPKKPESYRVVAKKEDKPLTDAMQKGDEPLRSFGDLLQFMSPPKDAAPAKEPPKQEAKPEAPPTPEPDSASEKTSPEKTGPESAVPVAETKNPGSDTKQDTAPPAKDTNATSSETVSDATNESPTTDASQPSDTPS